MPLGMNVGLGPGRVMLHEDRARPSEKGHIGNMHGKIGKDRACGSEDMLADRQTQTQTDTHRHTQTYSSQYFATAPAGELIMKYVQHIFHNV